MESNHLMFVGREVQLKELKGVLNSNRPELVAVYGRRRVGKTFLIREAAENNFTFYFTASNNISKSQQLANFALELHKQFNTDKIMAFANWFEAFHYLGICLDNLPQDENKIIFLDEVPWADSPKSFFLPALENFWNVRCAFHSDIKMVVCGSATSWIINKILHNRGGLYGRLTHTFKVEPFNLYESALYFKEYGYKFGEKDIAELYMVLGGIPYYFSFIEKNESVPQIIDRLFFAPDAKLKNEFNNLYSSLYKNSEMYINIVRELAKHGKGITRQELIKKLKIIGNGAFSTMLTELEECDLIRCYIPYEKKIKTSEKRKRSSLYQLIDLYSLFFLRFEEEINARNQSFWMSNYRSPMLNTWRGLSFEKLCLWHIKQIKEALGISGISSRVFSWTGRNSEGEKAQIDLLIDRSDNVVNICEMKYSIEKFAITKKIYENVLHKLSVFLDATKTKQIPMITFITSSGLKFNQYMDLAQKQVVLSQLFKY